jgi:hypothetical protein
VTNIGYTPVNKAGDTMSGALTAVNLTSSGYVYAGSYVQTPGYVSAGITIAAGGNISTTASVGASGSVTAGTYFTTPGYASIGTTLTVGTTITATGNIVSGGSFGATGFVNAGSYIQAGTYFTTPGYASIGTTLSVGGASALNGGATTTAPAANANNNQVPTTSWLYSCMSYVAAAAGFAFSVGAGSAYLKLPSWLGGYIIQVGTGTTTLSQFVTFPLTFPNQCLGALACEGAAHSTTWGTGFPSVHGVQSPIATNGFTEWGLDWMGSGWTGSNSVTYNYIALGY